METIWTTMIVFLAGVVLAAAIIIPLANRKIERLERDNAARNTEQERKHKERNACTPTVSEDYDRNITIH